MKVNELRIGNYLLGSKGEVRIVKEINENYYTDSVGLCTLLKHAKPIPLTEEWLLKFGFKRFSKQETLSCYAINMDKVGVEIIITLGQQYPCIEIADLIRQDSSFQYIHQLQNLYFALTGEELK